MYQSVVFTDVLPLWYALTNVASLPGLFRATVCMVAWWSSVNLVDVQLSSFLRWQTTFVRRCMTSVLRCMTSVDGPKFPAQKFRSIKFRPKSSGPKVPPKNSSPKVPAQNLLLASRSKQFTSRRCSPELPTSVSVLSWLILKRLAVLDSLYTQLIPYKCNSTAGALRVKANLPRTFAACAIFVLQMHNKKMFDVQMKVKVTNRKYQPL